MSADSVTYTISEAAALVERHPNTIRQRIRSGQLKATVEPGRFGDEYRISRDDLVAAGLLRDPVFSTGEDEVPPAAEAARQPSGEAAPAALLDLFQRHEQAMYRLGYLQAELERNRALAETAESLRTDRDQRSLDLHDALQELDRIRPAAERAALLADQLREAEVLTAQAQSELAATAGDLLATREQLQQTRAELLRLQQDHRQALDDLRAQLDQAGAAQDALRAAAESLKKDAAELRRRCAEQQAMLQDAAARPWWRPWRPPG